MFQNPAHNLKNLENVDELKNINLFRVMKREHFINWVLTGKNTMVSVDCWKDPWEKAIFKQDVISEGGVYTLSLLQYYGQCWSKDGAEANATWCSFDAQGGDSVRVEVNAFDLWNSFTKHIDNVSNHPGLSRLLCYCGEVQYLEDSEAIEYFEGETVEGRAMTKSFEDTLFIKRKCFSHEREFRLIYHPTDVSNLFGVDAKALKPVDGLYAFAMDPLLIRSVLFGPKVSSKHEDYVAHKEAFKRFKAELIGRGLTNISRSTSYDFPELNVRDH